MKKILNILLFLFVLLSLVDAVDLPADREVDKDSDGVVDKVLRYKKVVFNTAPYGGTQVDFGFRNNADNPLSGNVVEFEIGNMNETGLVEVEKAVQAYWDIIYYGTETAAFTLSLKLAGPLTATTDDTETIPWSVEWLSGNDTKTLGSANGAKTEEVLVDYPDNDLRTFSDEANLTLSALFDPDEIILDKYEGSLYMILETGA